MREELIKPVKLIMSCLLTNRVSTLVLWLSDSITFHLNIELFVFPFTDKLVNLLHRWRNETLKKVRGRR